MGIRIHHSLRSSEHVIVGYFHVAMIIRYLEFARFQPSIRLPVDFLVNYFEDGSIFAKDDEA